ncbi:MAG: hypothetical protein ABJO67_22185 [Pseudoruegeria sp.]
MTKHILDRLAPKTDGRMAVTFADVARHSGGSGPSQATLELQRRTQDRPPKNTRMREFTRLDTQQA